MRFGRIGLGMFSALAVAASSLSALAADLTAPPPPPVFVPRQPVGPSPFGILSEVRFGALAHGLFDVESGTVDVTGEVLTIKPYHTTGLWDYFIPRFHLGGDLNTDGKTSSVYGGVTWSFPVYERLFGELTFGGSLNDGETGRVIPSGFAHVGCNALFRESASVGYHLSDHWNVLATLSHESNASLCNHNAGITNVGAKLGYVF